MEVSVAQAVSTLGCLTKRLVFEAHPGTIVFVLTRKK